MKERWSGSEEIVLRRDLSFFLELNLGLLARVLNGVF